MNVTNDTFLEIIKYMDYKDIVGLCKTNKQFWNYCKNNKEIIIKTFKKKYINNNYSYYYYYALMESARMNNESSAESLKPSI